MTDPADVLIVVAHPDDAEFGAAGTVARWTREGKQIVYVVCTSGEKGTTDRSMRPEHLAEIREGEQMAAARGMLPPGYGLPGKRTLPTRADLTKSKNKKKAERKKSGEKRK